MNLSVHVYYMYDCVCDWSLITNNGSSWVTAQMGHIACSVDHLTRVLSVVRHVAMSMGSTLTRCIITDMKMFSRLAMQHDATHCHEMSVLSSETLHAAAVATTSSFASLSGSWSLQ